MEQIKLYRTTGGIYACYKDTYYKMKGEWDALVNRESLFSAIKADIAGLPAENGVAAEIENSLLAPIGSQEIWAAGVTYYRSRVARMEESEMPVGATYYDLVYHAERPELFFKSTAARVAGPGQPVCIRRDSEWNVPEPELTLFINSEGNIQGYTVGNDMSSRSIEGENPLYLPQAKVYEKSAAIGPCLMVPEHPIPSDTCIHMKIFRSGELQYKDEVPISQMKREHGSLAAYLYRECAFPAGCYLMTGTCLVPPNEFTLQEGDVVEISIDHIGVLVNKVRAGK